MKRRIAYVTLPALAGAGLTYFALIATPLRAQMVNRPMFDSSNAQSDWVVPRHAQRGQGHGWRHGHRHGHRHGGRHWGGVGPCPMYNGAYDASTLETIGGRVTNIERVGSRQGIWLQVETDQETFRVHLGPAWYLENQEVNITTDDTIEVTGIRGAWGGETTFAASAIKHANRTIELRDSDGYPLWMTWQTDQNSEVY
ncbi:hypothetical protein [Adonisia turfae]|nr:hypothetical protein [Adonisia turfae]